ncbi:transposase [Floccifex sp.]|uniref:transposase n=1 Tax=Floccifex sp. TaxID=2815810 RepID=UPI003F0DB5EB
MSYFTTHSGFFLVPLDRYDEELKKIDFLLYILEKSKAGTIIKNMNFKSETKGRNSYNPYNLFSLILFCFAFKKATLRDIEEMCKYDLRTMYLMDQETPSYKTISEFINKVVLPNTYELFAVVTSTIIHELGLDITDQYLDGTKFEANANKYKFVWKPIKFHEKLDAKIKDYLIKIDEKYASKELIKSHVLFEKINSSFILYTFIAFQ